ncbi:MAG: filamentous hemagglutinin N-terminal domain-containing protein [Cyanobacteria bacterium J06597_1]
MTNDNGATQLTGDCTTSCSIDGGNTQGVNRFHSFSEFSIPSGAQVQFINNNPDVENAIARVTGGNPTEIYGTLTNGGTVPNLNVFLLNPSGLLIGPGAQININGAFVGSTADTVEFGNLGEWETDLRTSPTGLTIHPSALLFNRLQPQPVTVIGAEITTGVTRSLFLSGSDISFSLGRAIAPLGNITLAAVGEDGGRLGLDLSLPQPVDFSSNPGRGDISIGPPFVPTATQPTPDTPSTFLFAPGRGNVVIRGENFTIEQAFIGQPGDRQAIRRLGLPSGSTSIEVDVSDTARFSNAGVFFGDTFNEADAGSISVRAGESLVLEGFRGAIASRTFGRGNGGEINIQTSRLELRGSARIAADTGGGGNGGTIEIVADSVTIGGGPNLDEFQPAINTFSLGKADLPFSLGDITLPETIGDAGTVILRSQEVQLISEGSIGTISNSVGNAGTVKLFVADLLTLSDRASVSVASNVSGDAGTLNISAGELQLGEGSILSAFSENGEGGNIGIDVDDILLLTGTSQISAEAQTQGGNIAINADFVVAGPKNNDISAFSEIGETGDVRITARDVLGFTLNNRPGPETSDITATSTLTFDRIDNRDLTRETIEPPLLDPAIDPDRLVYDPCRVDAGETLEDIGQFVFAGRGGLPLGPSDPLQADYIDRPWVERRETDPEATVQISQTEILNLEIEPVREHIVEAQGLGRDNSGQIVLTATLPEQMAPNPSASNHQCGELVSR